MEYTYNTYQVPVTTRLPYVLWQLMTEIAKGGAARTQAENKLRNYSKEIIQPIAEQFFDTKLNLNTSNYTYRVFLCITRHLIT